MPKLSYIAAQCRVRCEITRAETLKSAEPPADLISRAEEKLKSEQAGGRLAFYFIYPERLEESWRLLRRSWETPGTKLAVTLGAGSPPVEGISIEEGFFGRGFKLTISTPVIQLRKLRFYFLYLTLQNMLKERGIEKEISPSAVHAVYLKASCGYAIKNYFLRYGSSSASASGHAWSFRKDPKNRDIFLDIYSLSSMSVPVWTQLVKEYRTMVRDGEKKHGKHYQVLFPYIKYRMQAGNRGPERMDMDLPVHLLAASFIDPKLQVIDEKVQWQQFQQAANAAQPESYETALSSTSDSEQGSRSGLFFSVLGGLFTSKNPDQEDAGDVEMTASEKQVRKVMRARSVSSDSATGSSEEAAAVAAPGMEIADEDTEISPALQPFPLKVEFSEEDMVAKLSDCPEDIYDQEWLVDDKEILRTFKEQGLVNGIEDVHLSELKKRIKNKEKLGGLLVGQGSQAVPAANPFLKHSYLKKVSEADMSANQVDIRETQETPYVHKGDLVSAIGFSDPETRGYTVKGTEVVPDLPPDLDRFTAGEGIEKKGLEFFAVSDGIPEISGDVVSLSKVFKHEGDVNLSSGNLTYQGDVIIQGSVDVGAKVFVEGDLIIEGEILEAEVVVRGNLEVKGGILGKEKARVIVHGDLKLNFAEHCQIRVTGDLHPERSVINCHVFCKGSILGAGSESALTGGIIRCGKSVDISFLGKDQGDVTDIGAGVDWSREQCQERRKNRIKTLNSLLRDTQRELKKVASATFKNAEMQQNAAREKEKLTKRVAKLEKMPAAFKTHLEAAGDPVHNTEAEIKVDTELSQNLSVRIADNSFPVPGNFAKVVVHYKVRGGTHFTSSEEEVA